MNAPSQKRFSILLPLCLLAPVVGLIHAGQSDAMMYKIPAGQTNTVNRFMTCKQVANALSNDLMISTLTSAEWLSFQNNVPTSVTMSACSPTGGGTWVAGAMSASPYIWVGVTTNNTTYAALAAYPTPAAANGTSVAFNPQATLMAVGYSTSPYLRVYLPTTGSSAWVQPASTPVIAATAAMNTVRFSPDGNYLAVSWDETTANSYVVFNTSDWSKVTTPTVTGVKSLSFSSDGKWLALGKSVTPYLQIMNLRTWALVTDPATQPGVVAEVEFSPDSSKLGVGHTTTPFISVYTTTGAPSAWPRATPSSLPNTNVYTMAWSPDGTKLAYGTPTSPYAFIYTVATWAKATPAAALPNQAASVAWSPDGQTVMFGNKGSPPFNFFDSAMAAKPTPTGLPAGGATTFGYGAAFSRK